MKIREIREAYSAIQFLGTEKFNMATVTKIHLLRTSLRPHEEFAVAELEKIAAEYGENGQMPQPGTEGFLVAKDQIIELLESDIEVAVPNSLTIADLWRRGQNGEREEVEVVEGVLASLGRLFAW